MKSKKKNSSINICMLLPLKFSKKMLVYPRIEMFSHIKTFGHKVVWLTSSNEKIRDTFFFDGMVVYTIPYAFSNRFIFFQILSKFIFSAKKIKRMINIIRKENINLIFVRTDLFDGIIALILRNKFKLPFVFELPNPLEQQWETHKSRNKQPLFLYFLFISLNKFLTIQILRQADLIMPISKYLKDDFVKNKGINSSKIMPVHVGTNPEFYSNDGNEIIKKYQLKGYQVILYQGSLDKQRDLSSLIYAFSYVRKKKKDVKLLMVGEGDGKEELKNLSSSLGIEKDVFFTGQVPKSQVPKFIAAADICLSLVPPLYFYKFSSPIKMIEYMASKKPVIANEEIPEHKEVLEKSCGGVLTSFKSEEIAQAIIESLDNPKRRLKMGLKGRNWVIHNRSYNEQARYIEDKYLELLKKDFEVQ